MKSKEVKLEIQEIRTWAIGQTLQHFSTPDGGIATPEEVIGLAGKLEKYVIEGVKEIDG